MKWDKVIGSNEDSFLEQINEQNIHLSFLFSKEKQRMLLFSIQSLNLRRIVKYDVLIIWKDNNLEFKFDFYWDEKWFWRLNSVTFGKKEIMICF